VVTNLKDDVYLDGSGQLRTLIESLTKHYDCNAQAITPVQQNTGEVFGIVRKRLFDGLPAADRIDEVAQAYVDALQKAKRVDTIATTPETFIERIRETYPLHPSIRDIVARFAENPGYQKTRALIRLLRRAVRSAFKASDNAFLIGLQHLDFNDQAILRTQNELLSSLSWSKSGEARMRTRKLVVGLCLPRLIAQLTRLTQKGPSKANTLRRQRVHQRQIGPILRGSALAGS
jgi:uncharacterized protein DUF499